MQTEIHKKASSKNYRNCEVVVIENNLTRLRGETITRWNSPTRRFYVEKKIVSSEIAVIRVYWIQPSLKVSPMNGFYDDVDVAIDQMIRLEQEGINRYC